MAGRNDTDPLLPVLRLVIVRHGETTANAQGICQGQSPDPSYRLTPLGVTQARCAGWALRGLAPDGSGGGGGGGGGSHNPHGWPFWRVLSSDLPRARQTLSLILEPDQPGEGLKDALTASPRGEYPSPEYSPLLREYAAGIREGHPLSASADELLSEWRDAHRGFDEEPLPFPPSPPPPRRERAHEVAQRGRSFVSLLAADADAGNASASVALGGAKTPPPFEGDVVVVGSSSSSGGGGGGGDGAAGRSGGSGSGGRGPKVALVVSHGGFIRTFLQQVAGMHNVEIVNNTSFTTVDVFVVASGGSGSGGIDDEPELAFQPVTVNDTSHLRDPFTAGGTLMSASTL
jgi:broad specificity phosphatase PhoE